MTTKATIIADSRFGNARITTVEAEYPRFIHGQVMSHKVLGKNSSSSRAIPTKTIIKQIRANPVYPVFWGKNKKGMVATEETDNKLFGLFSGKFVWRVAMEAAILAATAFDKIGLHKQIANRVLEPFMHMKVVITGTEWNNFFYLRCAHDAQPEIQKLANDIKTAMLFSSPRILQEGQWHTPYYKDGWCTDEEKETALQISSACCAQVSYRQLKKGPKVCKRISDKLIEEGHWSPFEHIATPMTMDGAHKTWDGNLRGFHQYRGILQNTPLRIEAKRTQKEDTQ